MNPLIIALTMWAVVFGGALVGLWLQKVLPEHHLSPETKDVVRLSTALIATISALVLSLLVSSAKSSFDRFDNELTQNAAKVVMLDRALDEYGPPANDIRALLKAGYTRRIQQLFADTDTAASPLAITQEEDIDSRIYALAPQGLVQEGLKARAVGLNADINTTRALIHTQRYDSIPTDLLIVLGVWLSLIFTTFGLFAPRNAVVVGALLLCSISASGAVFLILEMNSPFTGLITISGAPMYDALHFLNQ
ncbi:MAG: hypothetical protein R3E50_17075 [Halioglobus sp.]